MKIKTSGLKFYTTIDLYFFKWEIIVCEKRLAKTCKR